MVEMEHDGNLMTEFLRVFSGSLRHISQQVDVRIIAGTLGNLENDWRLRLNTSLDNRLQLFHVVEVVRGNRIPALDSLREHFLGIHQAEIFV